MLKAMSDPNIAYLLMTIGTIGIIAELYSPGAILPGIVGAISLILAFYSLQSLPVNYAGVLLVPARHCLLCSGSQRHQLRPAGHRRRVSMLIGSLMLIKTDAEFLQISWWSFVPVVTFAAAFSMLSVGMA